MGQGQPRGFSYPAIEQGLWDWATSAPMRRLIEASAWDWPGGDDTLAELTRLAALSDDWDFRQNRERNLIEGAAAVTMSGRPVPDSLIMAAAQAFGMINAPRLERRAFSHLVVLSGLARACLNRAHYAAGLVSGGLSAGKVVALGGHRELSSAERDLAAAADLGDLSDEAEVILAATRRAFRLGEPFSAAEQRPAGGESAAAFHAASAWYHWPSVDVMIAPSSEPATRRANTADQLRHWAETVSLSDEDNVLVITTQIYVPYQRMEAVRILGLPYGCGVYCVGVDARTALLPNLSFSGRDYLQEIRSALRAAPLLLRASQLASGAGGQAELSAGGRADGGISCARSETAQRRRPESLELVGLCRAEGRRPGDDQGRRCLARGVQVVEPRSPRR